MKGPDGETIVFKGAEKDPFKTIFEAVKKEIAHINNQGVVTDPFSSSLLFSKVQGEVASILLKDKELQLEMNNEYIQNLVKLIAVTSLELRNYLDSFDADFE